MSEYIVGNNGAERIMDMGGFELRFQEREEIVRCRDCRYYGSYDGSWCCRTYEPVPSGTCDYQTVEPDGFCKWGERRSE